MYFLVMINVACHRMAFCALPLICAKFLSHRFYGLTDESISKTSYGSSRLII